MEHGFDPDHPLRPAFDKARDEEEHQRQQLTEEQRRRYDELKKKQEEEIRTRQQRIDLLHEEINKETEKQHRPTLDYSPPIRSINPHVDRLDKKLREQQANLQEFREDSVKARTDFLKTAQVEREQAKEQSRPKHEFNAKARGDRETPQPLHRTRFNEAARGKDTPEPLHTKKIAATREQDNLRQQQKERKAANRPGQNRGR